MSTTTYKKGKGSKLSKAKKAEISASRAAELKELGESLEAFAGTLTEAEKTAIFAQFDGYSPNNALLIATQRPGATDVRGFREWQNATPSRRVAKGEHGIRIMAPAGKFTISAAAAAGEAPAPGDSKTIMRYKAVSVFDVAQTILESDLPPAEEIDWELEFAGSPADL